jgi:hypothetical protein
VSIIRDSKSFIEQIVLAGPKYCTGLLANSSMEGKTRVLKEKIVDFDQG